MSADALNWTWAPGPNGTEAVLELSGAMTLNTLGAHWTSIMGRVQAADVSVLNIRADGLSKCDASGVAMLREIVRHQRDRSATCVLTGLKPKFQTVYDFLATKQTDTSPKASSVQAYSLPTEVGKNVVWIWRDFHMQVSFIGELVLAFLSLLVGRTRIKLKALLDVMDRTGVMAIPIVCVIGFLLGLILAFQMVIPLKRFGVDLYVLYMVTVAMFRELGPLITAILMAARTGSAFAAELGTMKVNEEIDALSTMGLDPVRFLVLSRILGVMCVIPILILLANAMGVLGAALVMSMQDYSSIQIMDMIRMGGSLSDLVGGLAKGVVFGLIVAVVGCQRGLRTGLGASAVGASTTSAVVSGILLVAIADGIFSVVFWALGI